MLTYSEKYKHNAENLLENLTFFGGIRGTALFSCNVQNIVLSKFDGNVINNMECSKHYKATLCSSCLYVKNTSDKFTFNVGNTVNSGKEIDTCRRIVLLFFNSISTDLTKASEKSQIKGYVYKKYIKKKIQLQNISGEIILNVSTTYEQLFE